MTINGSKNSKIVAQKIFDILFKGKVKSGAKLPSAEVISKENQISITSTREALQNLERIGLLQILHGKGIYVTQGGPIIEEMLEARKIMECINVKIAARRVRDADLNKFESFIKAMEAAIDDENLRSFIEADHAFHMAIAKAVGNRFIFKAFENTQSLLFYQQSTVNRYPGNPKVAIKQHKNIFKALVKRDPDSAQLAMCQHLDEAIRVWKKEGIPVYRK